MASAAGRLATLAVFEDASAEALGALGDIAEERTVAFGTVLVAQGEAHHETYVVIDGAVSVVIDNHAYPSVGAGGIVGELALFLGCEHAAATITTVCDVTLLVIDHASFKRVLQAHPDLWRGAAIGFAGRLHAMDSEHTQWNGTSAETHLQ